MIIGLMTVVERQQYCLFFLKNFAYNSVSKNYIYTTVFSDFKAKKKSTGKKLTIDAAIFKINILIWPQAIDSRKSHPAVHKQLLLWP